MIDSIPVTINYISTIYYTKLKKVLEADVSYKHIKAVLTGSEQSINIIDEGVTIPYDLGTNRLCLEPIKKNELKRVRNIELTTKGMGDSETYYKIVPQFTIEELLAITSWERFVRDTVLDGCIKDDIITNITLPLFIQVPLWFQNFNNHMLLLTGTKVGKTEIIRSIGFEPNQTVTTAGLLGSYARVGKIKLNGILEGKGNILIDEITQKKYEETGEDFANNILTYMEQGKVVRAIEGHPICEGSKTIILTGNTDKGLVKSTELSIQRLSGRWYPERFGSRFGFLLFANPDDMKRVDKRNANPKSVREHNIDVIKNSLFYVDTDKLFTTYKRVWDRRDNNFIKWLEDVYPFIDNDFVSRFISGYSKGDCDIRLRLMAFRTAIVLNMPIFLRKVKDKEGLYDRFTFSLLSECTDVYYEIYKQYVKWGIKKAFSQKMKMCYDLYEEGKTQTEISNILDVTQPTVSNWLTFIKEKFIAS